MGHLSLHAHVIFSKMSSFQIIKSWPSLRVERQVKAKKKIRHKVNQFYRCEENSNYEEKYIFFLYNKILLAREELISWKWVTSLRSKKNVWSWVSFGTLGAHDDGMEKCGSICIPGMVRIISSSLCNVLLGKQINWQSAGTGEIKT